MFSNTNLRLKAAVLFKYICIKSLGYIPIHINHNPDMPLRMIIKIHSALSWNLSNAILGDIPQVKKNKLINKKEKKYQMEITATWFVHVEFETLDRHPTR